MMAIVIGGCCVMKMVAEYLEKALQFEQMADREKDAKLKADLLAQAQAYRKLAAERALRDPLKPLHGGS